MRDGRTRKMERKGQPEQVFLQRNRVTLVLVEGPAAGSEFELAGDAVTVGRGDGVDLRFDDSAMSKAHAAFELGPRGYKVRDLGSTNGTHVNGGAVQAAELKHGDQLRLGEHRFQYLVEARARGPRAYELSGDDEDR